MDPNISTGGKALSFYSSQRLKMIKYKLVAADPITADEGIKIVCRVAKNRLAKGNPYKECSYYALYGQGIDCISELPDILEREGILTKAGSWYYLKDKNDKPVLLEGVECKWKSRSALIDVLKSNLKLRNRFEKMIDDALSKGVIKGVSMNNEEMEAAKKLNEMIESFDIEEEAVLTK